MSNPSIAFIVKAVKFEFDRTNPRQVYAVISRFYPHLPVANYTPKLISPFIPDGADPAIWLKTLRNVEYNINHPLTRPHRRSTAGKPRTRHNYAADVVAKDRVAS